MKYLIKLLSYLKYTMIPPVAAVMLWFSNYIAQSILRYVLTFPVSNNMVGQIVIDSNGQPEDMIQWFTRMTGVMINFLAKFLFYLNKWVPVEFIMSWGVFMMTVAVGFVTLRIVMKVSTFGQV